MARSDMRWRWLVVSSLLGMSCELRSVPVMDSQGASGAAGESARMMARDRHTSEDELVLDDHSRIELPVGGRAGAGSKAGASGRPDIREIRPEPSDVSVAGSAGSGASAADGGSGGQFTAPGPAGSGAAGSAGGSSEPGVATAAGSSAAAGSISAANGGGDAPSPGLPCRNEVCAPLPPVPREAAGRFSIANCCTPSGDCGTSINGGPCRFAPDSVPDCPLIEVRGFTIPNCCTSRGRCGVDFSAINDGCYSLDDVINWIGSVVVLPEPVDCKPD